MIIKIFWYWGFEDRCKLVEEYIGVEIITVTGPMNNGVKEKHRTWGNRG